MADKTGIEWTDATWNPVTGCSVVSPGCKNCYAMKLAGGRLRNHPSRKGLTTNHGAGAGPVWTGEIRFNEQWLTQPLGWRQPRKIFVCAHGDLFHGSVPPEWIDKVLAIAALAPRHTFQVLTKRASRMRSYMIDPITMARVLELADKMAGELGLYDYRQPSWPLPNLWLGVSVEDQQRAKERLMDLVEIPAAIRFISAEPLLGQVDLRPWLDRIQWVIAGGESGDGARPMHPDWVRAIRDDCLTHDVAFLFKQWGNWHPEVDIDRDDPDRKQPYADYRPPYFQMLNLSGGHTAIGTRLHVMRHCSKKSSGRTLDGRTYDGFPTTTT